MNMFYVMRGLPGSGKSTLVKKISESFMPGEVFIFSTDNYWIRPDGYYDFNGRRIGEAHAWNFKNCCNALDLQFSCVILDNTNTTLREFNHYVSHANKCFYSTYLVEPLTPWAFDVAECAKRNIHNVPFEAIQRMKDRWEPTQSIMSVLSSRYDNIFQLPT